METYKITYELHYPESNNDMRTAYVLAFNFKDAQEKVERNNKKEHESARVISIELIDATIYV